MSGQEDDTVPVPMRGGPDVEYSSAVVGARSQGDVALLSSRVMPHTTLFVACDPSTDGVVVVEAISCGGVPVTSEAAPVESLRYGLRLGVTVAEGAEVIVSVRNNSGHDVRVAVSLVSSELVDQEK